MTRYHLFHDWEWFARVSKVDPPRGPFDPTTDKNRSFYVSQFVCCVCGRTKESRESSWD
jgi:hypothetical protein